MIAMSLNQLVRYSAIAVLLASSACQSSPESAPPSDTSAVPAETAPAPDSDEAPDSNEATEPAPKSTTAETPNPAPSPAPAETAAAEISCSVRAFVADTDPAGLNVRSGPGSDFAIQDTLPTNDAVEVSIVGAANGWFLVIEAWSTNQAELEKPGWGYAPLLGVTTTSLDINDPEAPASLYEAPDGFSAVKTTVPKFSEVTLVDCSGDWLQVQTNDTTGWLAVGDQCSNPTSTCP